MHEAKDNLPTPIGTIDELLGEGDSSARPFKVFIGHNLGNRTFEMTVPMHDFFSISEVANERGKNGEPVAQRKLDESHARKLAIYILKGLVSAAIFRRALKKQPPSEGLELILSIMGPQPYLSLQPIVTNIRSCDPAGANIPGIRMVTKDEETACFKVMLSQQHVLWVIDGQHRRKGMSMVFEFLDHAIKSQKYPKKNSLFAAKQTEPTTAELQAWNECLEVARAFCTVTVEVHLGLGVDEERQLFHDLNNLAKKVEASLALQFDNSNPVNQFIKEVLFDDILGWEPIEKDIVDWQHDTGQLTRKDIVAVNAHLFLNKTNISGATPDDLEQKKDVAHRFWNVIKDIPGFGEDKAKLTTVAAQPVVLKALAKLTYDFAFSKRKPEQSESYLEKLLASIPNIDFSHGNPMWRYYEFTPAQRSENGLDGLDRYLPSDDEGFNRDIGRYDAAKGVMRFGAKHNDIYPILGDMIRWKLDLPSRHVDVSALLEELEIIK
jgi:hypothetical protein